MARTGRILIVDDEPQWRSNFASWIPEDLAEQHIASSAQEAASLLRRFHYDLVLLDLSMDLADSSNRDNRGIQQYLAKRPEGTRYFVVSGTASKEDTAEAAFRLGATDVLFKGRIDIRDLARKSADVIADASAHRAQSVAETRSKLIRDFPHDNELFTVLDPKHGPTGMYSVFDALFRAVVPIAQHIDRRHLAKVQSSVVALLWSRRLGTAVSAVFANRGVTEESARSALAEWMGFADRGDIVVHDEINHVRFWAFREPTVSDSHFDLPDILLDA